MFSKLMKWDFSKQKSSFVFWAIATLISIVTVYSTKFNMPVINFLLIFASVIAIIIAAIYSIIRLTYIIAKDMYGCEGYKNNMIAVKTSTLWHSKLLVGFFMTIFVFLMALLNFSILINVDFTVSSQGFVNPFYTMADLYDRLVTLISMTFGWSYNLSAFIMIAFILINTLILQFSNGFYVALSNSKIFERQGNVRYLLGYLLYYLGCQILTLIGFALIPINLNITELSKGIEFSFIFKPMVSLVFSQGVNNLDNIFPLSIFITIYAVLIAQYFVARNMMNKHLNLI